MHFDKIGYDIRFFLLQAVMGKVQSFIQKELSTISSVLMSFF